jgi:hypothetical protein
MNNYNDNKFFVACLDAKDSQFYRIWNNDLNEKVEPVMTDIFGGEYFDVVEELRLSSFNILK